MKDAIADITKTDNVIFRNIARTVKVFKTEEKRFLVARKKYKDKKHKVIDQMYSNLLLLVKDRKLKRVISLITEYKKIKKPLLWLLLNEVVFLDSNPAKVIDSQSGIRCSARNLEKISKKTFRDKANCDDFSQKLHNFWGNNFRIKITYSAGQSEYYLFGTTTRFFTEQADQ